MTDRWLIAGSRAKWWGSPESVAEFVDDMLDGCDADLILINGCADGVDTWAREAAERRGITVDPHPAEWRRSDGSFDKSAGYRRNAEMVALADHVYVVWDGQSPGTRHTIELALKAKKHLEVLFPASPPPDRSL